jgi:site-specific recombinase XerC
VIDVAKFSRDIAAETVQLWHDAHYRKVEAERDLRRVQDLLDSCGITIAQLETKLGVRTATMGGR